MSARDYAAGCIALLLTVVPWLLVGQRLSRRLLPGWDGPARALVAAIIGTSGLLVVAELLGIVGQFGRWQLATTCVVVGAAVRVWVRPGTPSATSTSSSSGGAETTRQRRRARAVSVALAGVCVLGASAAMLGRDAQVVHTGPLDYDAFRYHLSDAADFVRSGSITHIYQTRYADVAAYYPLDAELLDGVGMLGPRPDLATLAVNVMFGWLALLACWVIGERWRAGPAAVAAGSFVLALPLLVTSSGPGLNDIPETAALLAAVAVIVHAEARPQRWLAAAAVAGLALGLAAGIKLPVIGAVVMLAIATTAIAPARRLATAAILTLAAVATGGFWYVRDWAAVGSPLPEINLTVAGHGLRSIPDPAVRSGQFSVAHYLTNPTVIRHWYVPQLKVIATPLWPVVLGLAAAGIIVTLLTSGERVRRLLALVVAAGVVLYLVTPVPLGPPGRPQFFGTAVRFVVPIIAIAIVLAATAKPLRRFGVAVTAAFTGLTFAMLSSSTTAAAVDRPAGWAAAVVIMSAVCWGYAVWRRAPSRMVTAAVAVASLLTVVSTGWFVQRHYLRDRYGGTTPVDRLVHDASYIHGARIGVAGSALVYPFYGPRLDNDVSVIGRTGPSHFFGPAVSCPAWRRDLADGRYQYVVVGSVGRPSPYGVDYRTLLSWTASIPGSRLLRDLRAGTVVALPRHIAPCAAARSPGS